MRKVRGGEGRRKGILEEGRRGEGKKVRESERKEVRVSEVR